MPEHPTAVRRPVLLCVIDVDVQKEREAVAVFERLLVLAPGHVLVPFHLSSLPGRSGETEEHKKLFRRADRDTIRLRI